MSGPPPKFHGVSDLRAFFRTNQTPIYFVSPTAFNLLGMDRWVRNFHYVTYFDSFEGSHPNVFVPEDRRAPEFESIEDICNYLLRHPEVLSFTAAHGPGGRVVPGRWETSTLQYDPSRQYADFVVVKDSGTYSTRWLRGAAERTFGPPRQTYVVGPYTIMTWHANLLTQLGQHRG